MTYSSMNGLLAATLVTIAVVTAVVQIPGLEENPEKLNIEIFGICDYYCYTAFKEFGMADNEIQGSIQDYLRGATKVMKQTNIELVLVGLEIWNHMGRTLWTEAILDESYLSSWIGENLERYREKTYFDDFMFFTGMKSKTYVMEYKGVLELRGIHTFANIGLKGSNGMIRTRGIASPMNPVYRVIAHELGHGLGMGHDNKETCPMGRDYCIMMFGGNGMSQHLMYSNASMLAFEAYANSIQGRALKKPIATSNVLFSDSFTDKCGNGIIDAGEECDCGKACTPEGCCNCCDKCRLRVGAQCSSGPCCNSLTCEFKSKGIKCRDARDESCDYVDVCNGTSSVCTDLKKDDMLECSDFMNQDGYCKSGYCNTINSQCRFAWGKDYAEGDAACYDALVTSPNENANCGVNPAEGSGSHVEYIPCSKSGSSNFYKCHTLVCGGTSTEQSSDAFPWSRLAKYYSTGAYGQCLTGEYLGYETGLLGVSGVMRVEDGTKCGDNSACWKGACIQKQQMMRLSDEAKDKQFKRKTTYCGNGRLEENEECDCGPMQCPCCDTQTCKIKKSGETCLGSCNVCDGRSLACLGGPGAGVTEFQTCGGTPDQQCYKGKCTSLWTTCQEIYDKFAMNAPGMNKKNVGANNHNFNSGGVYLLNENTNQIVYEEYKVGEDDGSCGIIHCVNIDDSEDRRTSPNGSALKNKTTLVTQEYNDNVGFPRVFYYSTTARQLVLPNRGGPNALPVKSDRYVVMLPALAQEGTPCFINGTVKGYCRTQTTVSKAIPELQYPYSKCLPVNSS